MQKLPLLAALLCSLATAQAAGPAISEVPAVPAQHPLVGTWTWTLPGKSCTETWQVRADGTRLGTSGEETTQADYDIPPIPGLLGFYKLVETVTQSNGKRDCSGDLHETTGNSVTQFIQFSPKRDQLVVCRAESLKACYGPLKRVPG